MCSLIWNTNQNKVEISLVSPEGKHLPPMMLHLPPQHFLLPFTYCFPPHPHTRMSLNHPLSNQMAKVKFIVITFSWFVKSIEVSSFFTVYDDLFFYHWRSHYSPSFYYFFFVLYCKCFSIFSVLCKYFHDKPDELTSWLVSQPLLPFLFPSGSKWWMKSIDLVLLFLMYHFSLKKKL